MILGRVSASERMAPVQGVQPSERMRHITICGFSPGSSGHVVLQRDQRAAAHHHGPLLGEVQRHDGDVLQVDVLPDVEFGPVGEREDADALALIDAAVVEVPQFGALVLGVPLAEGVAEGVDALLGARFLFVAARAAEGRVEAALRRARRAGRGFSAGRSISGCRGGRGWRLRRWPGDWCGRSVWRRSRAQNRSRNSIISRNL